MKKSNKHERLAKNPTHLKNHQQKSTKPTSVESVPINQETASWQEQKERNKENKRKATRGFIIEGTQEGIPYTHNSVQIGRNEPCFCGSGKKFKKCHLEKQRIVQTA